MRVSGSESAAECASKASNELTKWTVQANVHVDEQLAKYRVFLKKVLHKLEGKMQEKIKMTSQKDKNLVQVQQQCSVYFCIKMIFES